MSFHTKDNSISRPCIFPLKRYSAKLFGVAEDREFDGRRSCNARTVQYAVLYLYIIENGQRNKSVSWRSREAARLVFSAGFYLVELILTRVQWWSREMAGEATVLSMLLECVETRGSVMRTEERAEVKSRVGISLLRGSDTPTTQPSNHYCRGQPKKRAGAVFDIWSGGGSS